jgi:ribonuclease P protein component
VRLNSGLDEVTLARRPRTRICWLGGGDLELRFRGVVTQLGIMVNQTFPHTARLRSGKDFERVYALKCKAADGVLLLFMAKNDGPATRIGLSVSKKHGGSVDRNRLKRWLREAFRLEQHQFPSRIDLIAIPLDGSRASLAAYRKGLVSLVKRLSRRLDQPAAPQEPPA